MLRSVEKILGYDVRGQDGIVGEIHDLYFDDESWKVRHIVVDTGGWLSGKKVLVSPEQIGRPDWSKRAVPVALTSEQLEACPLAETVHPVPRYKEKTVEGYFGPMTYWAPEYGTAFGGPGIALAPAKVDKEAPQPVVDAHLRSVRDVVGYHILASDGQIGHAVDFIAETEDWTIRYLVVDTRNWLPGRKVLVSPTWIHEVNWSERLIHVDLNRQQIKGGPEFDPATPINREYEMQLYDYYGRPGYWR